MSTSAETLRSEKGFDNPEQLAHISRLMDQGYAVYFGELATSSEVLVADEERDQYYALLMPLDDHQEQIHTLNKIHEAAHTLVQVRRPIYWLPEEGYEPIRRFADETVLGDPNLRTSNTAWGALVKAAKALENPADNKSASLSYLRQGRLRQGRKQSHR